MRNPDHPDVDDLTITEAIAVSRSDAMRAVVIGRIAELKGPTVGR
jgi:hypothetical protein